MNAAKKYLKFIALLLILLAGLAADVATKHAAMNLRHERATITVIEGFVEFSYVENRGMIFGMLNNEHAGLKRWALAVFSMVAIVALFVIIWRNRDASFIYHLPFVLILIGAIGNLLDRLRFGFVVDFIHMHWKEVLDYPWLYNIADACIVVGLVLLLIFSFMNKELLELGRQKSSAAE